MIYNNRPFDIDVNNDLFGIFYKADSIKNMLENNADYFQDNNLVALYGEWGSGKTSIMEYIKKTISNYNVLFFEAWRYEKDSNLSLSLFEMLLDDFKGKRGVSGEVLEQARLSGKTLFNMGKNIILNSKASLGAIELDLGQAGKDTIEQMNQLIERSSFYTTLNDFNTSLNELLDKYYSINNKKLLVFIDDLDRCAPENVLDLISGIKHFFVNSDKVVYFCGVDKNAVSRAIDIRYNNIVKSDDYLEKVFDVTFNMPEIQEIDKLVEDFISRVSHFSSVPTQSTKIVKDFLIQLKFTNPRKIKKLFNKYLFLCTLDNSNTNRIYPLIPRNFSKHEPVQMLFTLYCILLFEFHREFFDLIYNNQTKIGKLKSIFLESDSHVINLGKNLNKRMVEFLNEFSIKLKNNQLIVNNHILEAYASYERDNRFLELLLLFLPLDTPVRVHNFNFNNRDEMLEHLNLFTNDFQASEEKILSLFITFLTPLFTRTDVFQNEMEFNVLGLISMVNFYL